MRILALGVFLMVGAPAFAGDTFVFTKTERSDLAEDVTEGNVVVEGDKYRAELVTVPQRPPHVPGNVILSEDAGEHETVLDPGHHTFYDPRAFFEKASGGRQSTSKLFSPFRSATRR